VRCAPLVAVAATALICTLANAAEQLTKINVAAVDAQGQPVTGLQSSDFQLQQDGKNQSIAYFRFTGDKPLQAVKPPAEPEKEPHEYSNRAGVPVHETVVLIDLLSDRLMSGAMISEELTRCLKSVESTEGLYLYILPSSGELYPIHALPNPDTQPAAAEPWTQNISATLQTALKTVFSFKPIDERDVVFRFQSTMNALKKLGGEMMSMSGRKSLVWVTHGVPLNGVSISAQGRVDFTNPLRLVCEELERAQIVVYPVAESTSGAAAALVTESEQSLEEFSSVTGGRLYRSGGVGEALRQAITDARSNYELGYYAETVKADGKHHKLRVICARKEVRLQTIPGFYAVFGPDQPAEAERNRIMLAAHSPFNATEIGVRASFSPDPGAAGKMRFDVHIDPADLLLRQAGENRTGKLSLLFAVYGTSGSGQTNTIPIDVNLTPAQYDTALHGGLEFQQSLPVNASIQRVRVIVVDKDSGSTGSLTMPMGQ
jgi:VWFA-related protein